MKYVYDAPEIEQKIASWLRATSCREIVLVLGCLGNGLNSRLARLAVDSEWLMKLSKGKYSKAEIIDVWGNRDFDKNLAIAKEVVDSSSDNTLLIVNGWENIVLNKHSDWVTCVQRWHHTKDIGILLVSNKNLLSKRWVNALFESISFAPLVFYFGMWSKQLIAQAVVELGKDWKLAINEDIANTITEYCGGNIAIAKRLAWHYASGEKDEIESKAWCPDTLWIVERIWESLDIEERYLILDVINHRDVQKNMETAVSQAYLSELGLIGQEKQGFMDGVANSFVNNFVVDDRWQNIESGKLIIDGVVLGDKLSKTQQGIMRLLIENSGHVISREKMISSVWGHDDISDWAVDGQISRLRKILKEYGVSYKNLITKRNEGYIWQEK